jgi:hypothetical protein
MVINLYVILRQLLYKDIQTVDRAIYVRLVHKSAIYIIYNDQRIINPEYICLTRQFWDFTAKQFITSLSIRHFLAPRPCHIGDRHLYN